MVRTIGVYHCCSSLVCYYLFIGSNKKYFYTKWTELESENKILLHKLEENFEEREKFFKRIKLISPVDYLKRQEIILENDNRFSDIIQTLNSLLDVNQTTTEAEIDDIREESMKPIQTEDDLLDKISEILDQEPKQPATS